MNSFYSETELENLGLKSYGKNVLISRKASIYAADRISIGDNVRVDDYCILSGNISIGSYIHIAAYSALYGGSAGIVISDFANLSSRVCVYALSDDYSGKTLTNPMIPDEYKNVENLPVIFDKHVIVGTTSVILPGSHLMEGSAFGAFSFVKGRYDGWTVYAGVPARKLKERDKNLLNLEKEFILSNT